MRPIYLAQFGSKTRPVLVLTRAGQTIGLASKITVAGITSTVHGLRTEVSVGPENGLEHGSVVNLADIQTIRQMDLGRHVGYLFPRGEPALTAAVAAAFGLDL
jgi:mRNA interferase MazF